MCNETFVGLSKTLECRSDFAREERLGKRQRERERGTLLSRRHYTDERERDSRRGYCVARIKAARSRGHLIASQRRTKWPFVVVSARPEWPRQNATASYLSSIHSLFPSLLENLTL